MIHRPERFLRRLRLELDGTLRSRAFFSRAVRGILTTEEYRDLIHHLSALVTRRGWPPCNDLPMLASSDMGQLASPGIDPPRTHPCFAVDLLHSLDGSIPESMADRVGEVRLAVVGTSWVTDAADRLSRRWPHASSFLEELSGRASATMHKIQADVATDAGLSNRILGYAELTRGVLLGLATHLDTTWPAPAGAASFGRKGPRP